LYNFLWKYYKVGDFFYYTRSDYYPHFIDKLRTKEVM